MVISTVPQLGALALYLEKYQTASKSVSVSQLSITIGKIGPTPF